MAEFMDLDLLRRPKQYRRLFNPLDEFTDEDLYARYRLDREMIVFLSDLLRNDLECETMRSRAVPVEVQVMAGIRYLASNSLQRDIGDTFGIVQSSVSRILDCFLTALANRLPEFVHFPVDEESRRQNQRKFGEMAGFPQVVGCVDGTHVRVCPAADDEADFVNRKGFHSMNVQAICDHEMKFTNIVCRWPGRTHDSFILRNSEIYAAFEDGRCTGKILGDSGYPSRQSLWWSTTCRGTHLLHLDVGFFGIRFDILPALFHRLNLECFSRFEIQPLRDIYPTLAAPFFDVGFSVGPSQNSPVLFVQFQQSFCVFFIERRHFTHVFLRKKQIRLVYLDRSRSRPSSIYIVDKP